MKPLPVTLLLAALQLTALLLLAGCREPSSERPSAIAELRILAVAIEPAEVTPGELAMYRVLAVDPDGTWAGRTAHWSFCLTAKLLADNRSASETCAREREQPFEEDALMVEGRVPADACERFGPSVAAGERPRDPDASGGYYQPVRVELDGVVAVALQRISCPLPNAPLQIASAFRDRYRSNHNPELTTLSARVAEREVPLDAIAAGSDVTLQARWTPASSESYVLYDATGNELVDRREALQLSWFATAGSFIADRRPRDPSTASPDEPGTNTWHAPDQPGAVALWLVLRDSRGGSTFASYALTVINR